MDRNRIPVTIITGFLGAGKTTLINNIIRKHPEKKFAIIENEFGEEGIDGGLIIGADNNIFELSNGCICCSLNNDFYETLEKLLERKDAFNHLLIETTGIADPDSIVQAFISSSAVQYHFELDSVIGLVDAINLEDILDLQPEVRKQIALANSILINKVDAVQESYVKELRETLKQINGTAQIFPVSFSDITNIALLDTFSFSKESIVSSTLSFQHVSFLRPAVNQHQISTESFVIPGGLDAPKFTSWINNYLFFNQKNIYRVKGILCFEGEEDQYIFQSVRSEYLIEKGNPWRDKTRFSKIIFIGKDINRDKLEDYLYQLLPLPESTNN